MSLGFLNYNPQTGIQYPVYPYDSGMAYPPYGLPWPIEQTRGNAMLPYALSNGMCASNGQWPWFLRTPRVVTGPQSAQSAQAPGFWSTTSSWKTGLIVAGATFVGYMLIHKLIKGRKTETPEEEEDDFLRRRYPPMRSVNLPPTVGAKTKRKRKGGDVTAGDWLGSLWSRSKAPLFRALAVSLVAGVTAAFMQSSAVDCAVGRESAQSAKRQQEMLQRLQAAAGSIQSRSEAEDVALRSLNTTADRLASVVSRFQRAMPAQQAQSVQR